MKHPVAPAVLAAAVLACAGCASVTQGTTHSLRLETVTPEGEQVADAECTLSNDQGTTTARSGSSTIVRRSSKDLEISCAKAGLPDAKARLVSRANVGLAGNILVGGAIGAVIDHNTGAAYTYPTWVRLVFGRFQVFDRRDEHEGMAVAPIGAGGTVASSTPTHPTAAGAPAAAHAISVVRGDTFDYRVTDRNTGQQQLVVLRAERVRDGDIVFNGGSRIEHADGTIRLNAALTGELDQVTPPQGWLPGGRMPTGSWKMRHASVVPGALTNYDLDAFITGEETLVIDGQRVRTMRIALNGWIESRMVPSMPTRSPYEATAWIAPELGRVVRYEVQARGTTNVANTRINELVELVRIGRD